MPESVPAADALAVIPFQVTQTEYSVFVVLRDHNLDRIRDYDPAEFPVAITHTPWVTNLRLKDVLIGYATPDDWREVERLSRYGEITDALRLLTRGYRYRPDRGDGGPPLKLDHPE